MKKACFIYIIKRAKYFLSIILILCSFLVFGLEFSFSATLDENSEIKISSNTAIYKTFDPMISSDNLGHVYVVWNDRRNYSSDIHVKIRDLYFNYSLDYGKSWRKNDIQIAENMTGISNCQIVSDSIGHVYVVWINLWKEDKIYLTSSSNFGESWRTPFVVAESTYIPKIFCDSLGHVYIFYRNNYRMYCSYSSDYGKSWQASQIDINRYPEDICFDGHNIYVSGSIRHGSGDLSLNYSTDYGETWQPTNFSITDKHSESKISCNPSGYVYVSWNIENPRDIYFNYSTDYGETWQPLARKINSDNPDNTGRWHHQITSDQKGNVYVVWVDNRNAKNSELDFVDIYDIYFGYSHDHGNTWQNSDVKLNTSTDCSNPIIRSDANGFVYVCWESSEDNFKVAFNYSSDYGRTWQPNEITISYKYACCLNPQMSCDSKRNVYFIYGKKTGIYFWYFKPQDVYSPINVIVDSKINRSFFKKEVYNYISWEENFKNSEITISKYRIYKKVLGEDSDYELTREVNGDEFQYLDILSYDDINYLYAVSSIDSYGTESKKSSSSDNMGLLDIKKKEKYSFIKK